MIVISNAVSIGEQYPTEPTIIITIHHACSRLSIRHELLGIGWSLAFVSRVTTVGIILHTQ